MAMCVIAVVAFAPCQCFSPGLDRDHITWSNLLDRAIPGLYQAAASCHDQGLAQRVGMPIRPSARLKRNTGPNCMCWVLDRKSTRLNSSHSQISYAVFCLKKKKK